VAVESISTAMPSPAKPVFRQRFCRAPACRVLFFICSYCYRGQVYCSQACRQPARRSQCRQANRRQQQTLRGRLAHSRRQHAYRLRRTRAYYRRRENKVTDHSSQALLRVRPSRRVSSLYLRAANFAPLRSHRGLVVCQFCGRQGRFLKRD
jgi:hypothetical protein